ncbi:MAG: protein kinase [Acidimicrobiales bacterium]|nr:protein kinase [Acidimicrobiales bacterium]
MKVGEVLNGYRISTAPTNNGGGMSQWSFAEKDGRQYFVKMFLAPKFPLPDGPGSETAKARKRDVCMKFERRHLEIASRLDPSEPGGGNLVIPCDFFRVDSTYVKVMERVEAEALPPANRLTGHQLVVILRTLMFSLRLLHDKNVVHADVKPDNVLLKRSTDDIYVSKLIDFDEAYVVGDPPLPEHIVGDPVYYAPELLRYIKQDETLPPDALATSADIFSLGLLVHTWLVGDVPGFDRSLAKYPAEALLGGQTLDVSAAPPAIRTLLARMVALRPFDRPTIREVIDFLADVDPNSLVPTSAPVERVRPALPDSSASVHGEPARGGPPVPPATGPRPAVGGSGSAGRAESRATGAPELRWSTSEKASRGRPGARPAPPKPEGGSGLRSTMGRKRSAPPTEPPPTG